MELQKMIDNDSGDISPTNSTASNPMSDYDRSCSVSSTTSTTSTSTEISLRPSTFALTSSKYSIDSATDYNTMSASCLGKLDVLSCCPTKDQIHDASLRHRVVVCIFAISLMWLSSLQMCVLIANSYIETPKLDMVFDKCDDVYDLAKEEKVSEGGRN